MGNNKDYDETNSGVLFRNKDKKRLANEKDTSNWANAQGTLNVYGVEFWISAWTRVAKKGENKGDKFQSLAIRPKNEDEGKKLERLIKEKFFNQSGGDSLSSQNDLDKDLDEIDDDLPF